MTHNIAKWVVAALAIVWLPITSSALPIFFTDQIFKSIEQLDEALAAGEISEEDYELVREALLGENWLIDGNQLPPETADHAEGFAPKNFVAGSTKSVWSYRSTHTISELHSRIDRMSFRDSSWYLDVEVERTRTGDWRMRKRSFGYHWGRVAGVGLGDVDLWSWGILTVGNRSAPAALRQIGDFGSSWLFPSLTRQNGIGGWFQNGRVGRNLRLQGYSSHVEGNRHFRTSHALAIEMRLRADQYGLTVLHQSIGELGRTPRRAVFLAPQFKKELEYFTLYGESSLMTDGGAAHQYQLEVRRGGSRLDIVAFAYGRNYRNVESGGYAYGDYGTTEISEIDFEYSDKRTGRRGVAVEVEHRPSREVTWRSELIRWRNSLVGREGVAVRVVWMRSGRTRTSLVRMLRLQGLWEDLDLAASAADSRQWLTATTELRLSERLRSESLVRIGRRTLSARERAEWRARNEIEAKVAEKFRLAAAADWRDSDWGRGGDEKLLLAISERYVDSAFSGISLVVQTRYYPERGKLDDWEVRLDTKLEF
ncbi:MAG: SHOCT domain-containing protein [candidate division Zixibacteria bacterium]|nr:SHOCT domain-containing protein [candidate division Zixibacteria bacterium]